MTTPIRIDYVEDAKSLLPSQWEDSTRVQGLLESYMLPVQDIEDQLLDIRSGFNANTAVGVQLDIIGGLRGISRLGRGDSQYRQAILSYISVSMGSGTHEDILNLLAALSGGTRQYLWEHYPLGSITYTDTPPNYGIPKRIRAATAASVVGGYVIFDPENACFAPVNANKEEFTLVNELFENIQVHTVEIDQLLATPNVPAYDTYSGVQAYLVNDAVKYNGLIYICIANSTGNLPTNIAFWVLYANLNNVLVVGYGEGYDEYNRSSFPDNAEASTTRPLAIVGYLDSIEGSTVGYGLGYGNGYGGAP